MSSPLPSPVPSPAAQRARERTRRRKELFFAACAFVVVLILTSMQLEQFRTTSGGQLYVVMFSVNFVLLLGIFAVVLRNGLKLLLERRRRVLGSRLRTRLVLAFVSFSLLPCVLMFLVTTKYVQLSIDFWFKEQIENSMEAALDVGHAFYERTSSRLLQDARTLRLELEKSGTPGDAPENRELFSRTRSVGQFSLTGFLTADGRERNWHATPDSANVWSIAKSDINWEEVRSQGSSVTLTAGGLNDYIFTVLTVERGRDGYLVLADNLGPEFKVKLDRIVRGAGEYKNLRKIKKPLKLLLYSSLGVLTAIIILGAVWYGFRVAREMSAPLLALASGTERVAKGDLSVRLTDDASDEMGLVIRSFNDMARDLERSRQEITGANAMLEEQNRKIARHSEYMETVLNNIAAGVISFERDGRINTVNHAVCDMLQATPEQLLGKKMEDLYPEYAPAVTALRTRLQQRLEIRSQHNVTLRLHGEERRLLINVVGFSTEEAYSGAVAVVEDVSELERMQRLAAWREVARRIAHEIKNPLTPIKLSAQRLARKFGAQVEDPAFTQSTRLIVRQVEHLQNMVQEFSAFAKLPEVKPCPGNLEPLLQQLTDLFSNSHSSIRWRLDMAASLPRVSMDREALHRAFMNIYTNAAEALIQSETPHPEVSITAAYQPDTGQVRIDVADNGPGLSEEERARVFEPYFSRKKGGTGLGLTIVRSIVTDHRGYVRALSRECGGTVISMELPLA